MRWIEPFLHSAVQSRTGSVFVKKELFASEAEFERWRGANNPHAVFELSPGALRDIIPLPSDGNTVRLIRNPKNVGVAESANIGIRASTSRFFFRLDADDFLREDAAELLVKYMKDNKDAFCVSCDYHLFNSRNEEKMERRCAVEDPIACGICYRRDEFLQYGGYDRDARHREEELLRKRLGELYIIHHLHMPLLRYRMHELNKTKEPGYQQTQV
jgi:glycosyltransferase involved in cell wall biosynthesis